MEKIELSHGLYACVDDEDFGYVLAAARSWHAAPRHQTWYARGVVAGQHTYMHHVLMGSPSPGMEVDHINGRGWDNRRSNLRWVGYRANALNTHACELPGVRIMRGEWQWALCACGQPVCLRKACVLAGNLCACGQWIGAFPTALEAYLAALSMAEVMDRITYQPVRHALP